jgi:LemA protein
MWIVFAIVLASALGTVVWLYNRLVWLRNLVDESWSSIDVHLKRRHDLIPNLVEAVKGYARHEQTTLEKVVQYRSTAVASKGIAERAEAESALSVALRNVFAVAEAYPDLKASESFIELQNQLAKVEDDLQLARRFYNAAARDFKTACEAFPSVIVAHLFGFTPRTYFEIERSDAENVRVQFE